MKVKTSIKLDPVPNHRILAKGRGCGFHPFISTV
jgi:hypothetical protein